MGKDFDYVGADRDALEHSKYKINVEYDGKRGAHISVCKYIPGIITYQKGLPPPPPFYGACKSTYIEVLFARNRLKKINKTINKLILEFEAKDDPTLKEEFYI